VDSAGQAAAAGLTVDKAVSFGERWENQAVSGGGAATTAAVRQAYRRGPQRRGGTVTSTVEAW
jgi:hypothetical protein